MPKVMEGGFRVTPSSTSCYSREDVYVVNHDGLEWLDEDGVVEDVPIPSSRSHKWWTRRKRVRREPKLHHPHMVNYTDAFGKVRYRTYVKLNYPNFPRSKRDRKRERLRQEKIIRDQLFGDIQRRAVFYDQMQMIPATLVLGVDMVTFIEEVLGAYRTAVGTTGDDPVDVDGTQALQEA